ncbi:uncharacterized protein LOC142534156 [Primulina tabacum]|uniref:uncharacterized protein LOC142534156 n=1 Tax=Primulina tabacum TaxID=48773 RepID=UPI003F59794D
MAALAAPLSPTPLSLILDHKSLQFVSPKCSFSPLLTSALESPTSHSSRRRSHNLGFPNAVPQKPTKSWRLCATGGIFSLSEAIPDAIPEEIVPTSDDGVSTVISGLLFVAFIGLSVLTIGIVYIAVTDFLQKREREKLRKKRLLRRRKMVRGGKLEPELEPGLGDLGRRWKKAMMIMMQLQQIENILQRFFWVWFRYICFH